MNLIPFDELLPHLATSRLMTHIRHIDLEPVRKELIRKNVMYRPEAACAISEYRKYLFILGYDIRLRLRAPSLHAEPVIAPDEVSEVWHTHILMTKQYREDCEMVFGQFIDHGFSPMPGTNAYQLGIENFRILYCSLAPYATFPKCFTFSGEAITREEYRKAHKGNR